MLQRDYRDVTAGSLLSAIGLFVALYCVAHYDLGTLRQLGPGLFPTALGVLLFAMGILIAVPALRRSGTGVAFELRPALSVLASIALFAASIDRLGLIPAIVLLTLVAGFADRRPGVLRLVYLMIGLSLLGTVIFRFGLGLPVYAIRWPF